MVSEILPLAWSVVCSSSNLKTVLQSVSCPLNLYQHHHQRFELGNFLTVSFIESRHNKFPWSTKDVQLYTAHLYPIFNTKSSTLSTIKRYTSSSIFARAPPQTHVGHRYHHIPAHPTFVATASRVYLTKHTLFTNLSYFTSEQISSASLTQSPCAKSASNPATAAGHSPAATPARNSSTAAVVLGNGLMRKGELMLSIPVVRTSLGSMRLKDDGNRADFSLIVGSEWERSEGM